MIQYLLCNLARRKPMSIKAWEIALAANTMVGRMVKGRSRPRMI